MSEPSMLYLERIIGINRRFYSVIPRVADQIPKSKKDKFWDNVNKAQKAAFGAIDVPQIVHGRGLPK